MRKAFLALVLVTALVPALRPSASAPAPVYVTLWFDVEDYLLPQDDDATKRLAELLSRLGVRATFKIVGEKARVLERRRRSDVIAALKRHDIGYHSNTHSQQPTIAVYLQNAGWEDGRAEFKRREQPGVNDITRIFGVTPGGLRAARQRLGAADLSCPAGHGHQGLPGRGRPGRARRSAVLLRRHAQHLSMRSTLVRMALDRRLEPGRGPGRVRQGARRVDRARRRDHQHLLPPERMGAGGVLGRGQLPRGANPPPGEWKPPRMRPAAETEKAFADFEQFIRFIKAREGVRFVTATELAAAVRRPCPRSGLRPHGSARDCASGAEGFRLRDVSTGTPCQARTCSRFSPTPPRRWSGRSPSRRQSG